MKGITGGRWFSPAAITGILLGSVILVIISWLEITDDPGESQAIAAAGILMGTKFLISTANFFCLWLSPFIVE